jgi:CRP-like cAMP-binding protein
VSSLLYLSIYLSKKRLLLIHLFRLTLCVNCVCFSQLHIRGLDFGGDSSGSDDELFEDKNDCLYVVESGKIEVRVGPGRGRFIGKMLPGDCFGEV